MENIDDNTLYEVADLFKIFSDSTRIRILYALSISDMYVNEIAEKLNLNQTTVSHQLKILKQSKLIKARRNGKSILYSLDDDHVYNIIRQGVEHVNE